MQTSLLRLATPKHCNSPWKHVLWNKPSADSLVRPWTFWSLSQVGLEAQTVPKTLFTCASLKEFALPEAKQKVQINQSLPCEFQLRAIRAQICKKTFSEYAQKSGCPRFQSVRLRGGGRLRDRYWVLHKNVGEGGIFVWRSLMRSALRTCMPKLRLLQAFGLFRLGSADEQWDTKCWQHGLDFRCSLDYMGIATNARARCLGKVLLAQRVASFFCCLSIGLECKCTWWTFRIFLISFLLGEGEGRVRGARSGGHWAGIDFLMRNPKKGGVSRRGAGPRRREDVWGGLGGGGGNLFFGAETSTKEKVFRIRRFKSKLLGVSFLGSASEKDVPGKMGLVPCANSFRRTPFPNA